MRRIGWVVACVGLLVGLAAIGWWLWRGPDPLEILARTEVPGSPVLSPDEALRSFRTAPGFEVRLVAAEPLVVDPVAMDWDDQGRLYVVEMRGFMPDLAGSGEERPSGQVVVLEDTDGDGRMDRSDVFADGLVLPRAIAVLPEGVLIGAPPDLWLCRDLDGDRACDERTRLSHYGVGRHDPEHLENGLLPGIDGWIYNAKSRRRFRFQGGAFEIQPTAFRGQWGIAQDDEGRLFYNHNSAFVYGDAVPGEYAMRQPATASALTIPGVGLHLTEGTRLHGIRVAPGLNRAYLAGTLRADGRQDGPTAASGLVIQRGDQYGDELSGDAFVPEPGSNVVTHFSLSADGLELSAEHRTYPDPDWDQREFLASSDERFRPVDVKVGPDGAIWVIDMYRGLIQHANYVSEHLAEYATRHDLVSPGREGRIWRILRTDRASENRPPPLSTLEQQLAALDHPNGWVRDRAQRRIVFEADPAAVAALGKWGKWDGDSALGRLHALWTLDGLQALGDEVWLRGLADTDPAVRRTALRAGERLLSERASPDRIAAVVARLEDPDAAVRLQALHSLGAVPPADRPLQPLLAAGAGGDELRRSAAVSSLAGLEAAALAAELERIGAGAALGPARSWLSVLSAAVFLAARAAEDPTQAVALVLDRVHAMSPDARQLAVLEGIAHAQRRPGSDRFELASPHPLFEPFDPTEQGEGAELVGLRTRLRRRFTWPGDETPGGARALTGEEAQRRARGEALYAESCFACHGVDGRGQPGLAPPLAGSSWVRDSDDWLTRIVLNGLQGPILVRGEPWNLAMPGHRHDPRFDDAALAGLLTHLRRSWGHAGEPVSPETVARIRAETAPRVAPWTAPELLALAVDHRLDRYTGVYRVPVVGMEIEVVRRDHLLAMGILDGGKAELVELGEGGFSAEGFMLQFEIDEDGEVSATGIRDGISFPLSKVE